MNEVHELLKRWADLAPEECRFQGSEIYIRVSGRWHRIALLRDGKVELVPDGFHLIQSCVQEAVMQRQWFAVSTLEPKFNNVLIAPSGLAPEEGRAFGGDKPPASLWLTSYVYLLQKLDGWIGRGDASPD